MAPSDTGTHMPRACTRTHTHPNTHTDICTHAYLETQKPAQNHTQVNAHINTPTYTETDRHSYHHTESCANTKTIWKRTQAVAMAHRHTQAPRCRQVRMRSSKPHNHNGHMHHVGSSPGLSSAPPFSPGFSGSFYLRGLQPLTGRGEIDIWEHLPRKEDTL